MKRIKDPIHSYILVEDEYLPLIDSSVMQRLRFVKQLGMASLVYPGANHTRFEHSLGTYHLAKLFNEHIDLGKEIVVAALLHDIGHGPFSHTSDNVSMRIAKKGHLDHTCRRIESNAISVIIESLGMSVKTVKALIRGRRPCGTLLSGSLDVDRLDYLMRDSYYTGANFGSIDIGRLLTGLKIERNRVIIDEKCVSTVESILTARSLMYPSVYYHHTVRIAGIMMESAIEHEIEEGRLGPEELMDMDDPMLISFMRRAKNKEWERIERRKLYKIAYTLPYRKKNKRSVRVIEEGKHDLGDGIIIDNIAPPIWVEMDLSVEMKDGGIKRIAEVSSLASILSKAQRDHYRLVIYAPEEKKGEVRKRVKKIAEE